MAHAFDLVGAPVPVREDATKALWSAVRALEDKASAARWRLSQPDPAPYLQGVIDKATGEVIVLRDILWRWREQDEAAEAQGPPNDALSPYIPSPRGNDAAAPGRTEQ